jgi:hypothetical protein
VSALPARRSAIWSAVFRVGYRLVQLLDPLIRSWLANGLPGLGRTVELRSVGRRTGRPRSVLLTLLTVDGRPYLGHPNGPVAWTANIRASGWAELDPPGPAGPRYAVVPLEPGPERDAVIRATWWQQPFPANLLYRAAARHVAAVGVYHRLDPLPPASGAAVARPSSAKVPDPDPPAEGAR